jgi:hypothetical protein
MNKLHTKEDLYRRDREIQNETMCMEDGVGMHTEEGRRRMQESFGFIDDPFMIEVPAPDNESQYQDVPTCPMLQHIHEHLSSCKNCRVVFEGFFRGQHVPRVQTAHHGQHVPRVQTAHHDLHFTRVNSEQNVIPQQSLDIEDDWTCQRRWGQRREHLTQSAISHSHKRPDAGLLFDMRNSKS